MFKKHLLEPLVPLVSFTELGKSTILGKTWVKSVDWRDCQKEAEKALDGKSSIPDQVIDPIDGKRISIKSLILSSEILESPTKPEPAPDSQNGGGGVLTPKLSSVPELSSSGALKSAIRRVLSEGHH